MISKLIPKFHETILIIGVLSFQIICQCIVFCLGMRPLLYKVDMLMSRMVHSKMVFLMADCPVGILLFICIFFFGPLMKKKFWIIHFEKIEFTLFALKWSVVNRKIRQYQFSRNLISSGHQNCLHSTNHNGHRIRGNSSIFIFFVQIFLKTFRHISLKNERGLTVNEMCSNGN